jgi:hypothetical protein
MEINRKIALEKYSNSAWESAVELVETNS